MIPNINWSYDLNCDSGIFSDFSEMGNGFNLENSSITTEYSRKYQVDFHNSV